MFFQVFNLAGLKPTVNVLHQDSLGKAEFNGAPVTLLIPST